MKLGRLNLDTQSSNLHKYVTILVYYWYREWVNLVRTDGFHTAMLFATAATITVWVLHSLVSMFLGKHIKNTHSRGIFVLVIPIERMDYLRFQNHLKFKFKPVKIGCRRGMSYLNTLSMLNISI